MARKNCIKCNQPLSKKEKVLCLACCNKPSYIEFDEIFGV